MRIAIVSNIHDNMTALRAVLADRRGRAWLFALVSLAAPVLIFFAGYIVWTGWRSVTAENNITCQKAFQPLRAGNNGDIEFFVDKEEVLEPIFDGGYFINLADAYGKNPLTLKVTATGARNYGSSTSFADLHWDARRQVLWMDDKASMYFISLTNSHRMFPFDSARFDYELSTDPTVNIPVFRFTDRVPGFIMLCDQTAVSRQADGAYHVSFELRRNPFIPLAASVLFGAAVFFCIGIAGFVETKALPTALASFFFSLWSIRGIFGLEAQGFPTLFDVGILALCLLILALLFLRFTVHLFREYGVRSSGTKAK